MDNTAVINASPLIFLSRSSHLNILKNFANNIIVSEPVSIEINAKGPEDITAQKLKETSWLNIYPAEKIPDFILEWGLGAGESAVLASAYNHGIEAIIDDLAGRKCARSINIPVRGTLGLVLIAKRRGLIPQARPVLEDLIQSGLYLSNSIIKEALKRVNE